MAFHTREASDEGVILRDSYVSHVPITESAVFLIRELVIDSALTLRVDRTF